jgi:Flp pilus assembly protein TadG
MPARPEFWRDKRGAVALLFALLAPLLLLAIAFGIDVPSWYRDALHLQGLADRAALSAGPLWADGQHKAAVAVAEALVAADGATLDHAGADRAGGKGFEVAVSNRKAHLLASLPLGEERQQAHAVVMGRRLVE